MPARSATAEVVEYLSAFGRHWGSLVTGGVLIGALSLRSSLLEVPTPSSWNIAISIVGCPQLPCATRNPAFLRHRVATERGPNCAHSPVLTQEPGRRGFALSVGRPCINAPKGTSRGPDRYHMGTERVPN